MVDKLKAKTTPRVGYFAAQRGAARGPFTAYTYEEECTPPVLSDGETTDEEDWASIGAYALRSRSPRRDADAPLNPTLSEGRNAPRAAFYQDFNIPIDPALIDHVSIDSTLSEGSYQEDEENDARQDAEAATITVGQVHTKPKKGKTTGKTRRTFSSDAKRKAAYEEGLAARRNRTLEERSAYNAARKVKRDNRTEAKKMEDRERRRRLSKEQRRNGTPQELAEANATRRLKVANRSEAEKEKDRRRYSERKEDFNAGRRAEYAANSEERRMMDRERRHNRSEAEWDRENQVHRDGRHARERQRAYNTYQAFDLDKIVPTPVGSATTTALHEGVYVIVIARHSWVKSDQVLQNTYDSNAQVLQKFVADFVNPTPVNAVESVVWNGRPGGDPLPWVAIGNGNDQMYRPLGDFNNADADERFVEFLNACPGNSMAILLVRGIDGGTIFPGSWYFLAQRYPTLDIVLIFQLSPTFVEERVPGLLINNFRRANPYDGKLYMRLDLNVLTSHMNDTRRDQLCVWMLGEWELGKVYREALSRAYSSGSDLQIRRAQEQFDTLQTRGRNVLPGLG